MSTGETSIYRYDMATAQPETIATYTLPIALSYEAPYLVWYEVRDEQKVPADTAAQIIRATMRCYNSESGEIRVIEGDHVIISPYQRARVLDSAVTFFSEESGTLLSFPFFIAKIDLESPKILDSAGIFPYDD